MRTPAAIVALLLLSGCGTEQQPPPAPPPLGPSDIPVLEDVVGSSYSDDSCACEIHGLCANIADAIPGYFEGRALECRLDDAAARTVRCTFERRYWDATEPAKPIAGEWKGHGGIYHHNPGTGWCEGRRDDHLRP